ncbi:MAG: hypothetical protein ABIN67_00430 [Ferruginibacter sp.]
MSVSVYIKASCIIRDHRIIKNGLVIFEGTDTGLPNFLNQSYQFLETKYPKFYKMDHLSKMGWLAAEVLLKESFDRAQYRAEDIGVVLMNANSSLDADIKYFESTKDIASPSLFVYTLANIVIGEISIKNNFKGESAFFIFEKFDAGFLTDYVSNLFSNNIVEVCICGWVEVLGETYKTALYLIEKEGAADMAFTKENLNKIYQS